MGCVRFYAGGKTLDFETPGLLSRKIKLSLARHFTKVLACEGLTLEPIDLTRKTKGRPPSTLSGHTDAI